MTDFYLIAHKVRGEPAFDVAIQIPCPECEAHRQAFDDGSFTWGCSECDQEGRWWIIPTSGHRAYPWWSIDLHELAEPSEDTSAIHRVPPMPLSLPDHYHTTSTTRPSLVEALGIKPKPAAKLPPIQRRL